MYGHGYPQPAPPPRGVPASVIVLRVLFAVLPLLSLGLLAWVTALRIGLLTRRVLDWILLGLSVAVVVAGLILMPDENDTSLKGDLVVGMVLLNAVAFTAYFLVVDIRHDHTRAAGAPGAVPPPPLSPYHPYAATVPRHHQGYGYPQPQPHLQAQPQPPHQARPQPHLQPHPHPQPVAPANPRIDQVRVELDELSDLLRKDPREGGR
ncbi:hypothetical protein ACIGO8_29490 [Streptomyces sp. NPDC053493]|uniref:hypothetical protein n=1 Tax=Streptomyces sp. NPDC053493 TaxID=3365705 RepID=UPI0037D6E5F1